MAGYIGVQPVPKATQRREYFTATNNQTTFNTAGYTPDYVDVYMNGVKLSPADFTATNGSDVVLASGATTGDLLQIISFLPFQAANQAFTGTLSATGVVTANAGVVVDNITIDGNDISTTNTNGNLTITPNGTGDLQVNCMWSTDFSASSINSVSLFLNAKAISCLVILRPACTKRLSIVSSSTSKDINKHFNDGILIMRYCTNAVLPSPVSPIKVIS